VTMHTTCLFDAFPRHGVSGLDCIMQRCRDEVDQVILQYLMRALNWSTCSMLLSSRQATTGSFPLTTPLHCLAALDSSVASNLYIKSSRIWLRPCPPTCNSAGQQRRQTQYSHVIYEPFRCVAWLLNSPVQVSPSGLECRQERGRQTLF